MIAVADTIAEASAAIRTAIEYCKVGGSIDSHTWKIPNEFLLSSCRCLDEVTSGQARNEFPE